MRRLRQRPAARTYTPAHAHAHARTHGMRAWHARHALVRKVLMLCTDFSPVARSAFERLLGDLARPGARMDCNN